MKLEAIETDTKPTRKPDGLSPELIAFINEACHKAAMTGADTAAKLSAQMMADAVDKVEARLNSMEAPPRMIARIQLDDKTVNLAAGEEISEQSMKVIGRAIGLIKGGRNVMFVGPAGCGKTTLAQMIAKILDRPFGMISWTAGLAETPSLFARQFHDRVIEAQWSEMYEKPGIFCHDEFDRADPNARCKTNAGLANGHFYNEVLHVMKKRHADFGVIATANTFGRGSDGVYHGANAQDESSNDRFVMIAVDYDQTYEKRICPNRVIYKLLTGARKKLRDLNAVEVISTRKLQNVYFEVTNGIATLTESVESMTMAWSQDLVKQVGLDADTLRKLEDIREDAKSDVIPEIAAGKIADAPRDARLEELKRKLAGGQ